MRLAAVIELVSNVRFCPFLSVFVREFLGKKLFGLLPGKALPEWSSYGCLESILPSEVKWQ
jgi:hypothetical protein